MNTFTALLALNAGGAIAAVVGILVGIGGAIACAVKVKSSSTPSNQKAWWASGIVAGGIMVVLGILVLAGVI